MAGGGSPLLRVQGFEMCDHRALVVAGMDGANRPGMAILDRLFSRKRPATTMEMDEATFSFDEKLARHDFVRIP